MPGFAPNYTTKWKLGYLNGGKAHHLVLNLGSGATSPSTTNRAQITAFINALAAYVYQDFQWVSSEIRVAGGSFFVPTTMPTQPNVTAGMVPSDPDFYHHRAGQVSFTANAGAAGRTAVYLHGVDVPGLRWSQLSPWRVTTDMPAIAAAITALNAGGFRTAGDGEATFKQYANLKYNDHHVKDERN